MQKEKNYLVDEVSEYLDKSNYVFLTDFTRLTVAETEELRGVLSEVGAEFHVVKNRILKIATDRREWDGLNDHLKGPTAIVVGGENAPGVAKALEKFFKAKSKVELKAGILDGVTITTDQISDLAKLPSEEVLRAQFLGLLNQPGTQFVRVIQAVPQGLLNVLQAKAEKE